jgi:elongation factor G
MQLSTSSTRQDTWTSPIEVERSLRVLDGAILVLVRRGRRAVAVHHRRPPDAPLRRAPRGFREQVRPLGRQSFPRRQPAARKLNLNAVMIQIPLGLEDKIQGVVDLVTMKAYYNEGDAGETVVEREIPADHPATNHLIYANILEEAKVYREKMLDGLSPFDEELDELRLMEQEIPVDKIRAAIRKGVIALELVPVLCGSAYKNRGVQKLLDGVNLPTCPTPTTCRTTLSTWTRAKRRSRCSPTTPSRWSPTRSSCRTEVRPAHLRARVPGHAHQGRPSTTRPPRRR